MHQMEQGIHELYFKLNGSTHFAKLMQCILGLKFYTDFKLMISEVATFGSYCHLHLGCVVNLNSL